MPLPTLKPARKLRNVLLVLGILVFALLLRDVIFVLVGKATHANPQLDRLSWSETSRSIVLRVFQGRKRGIFAENLQVKGVFIVDAETIRFKMPHEDTDAEKLESGKLHHLGTVCDVKWAALRPGSFRDFQSSASLPLLAAGELKFGPLPDDVMELLRSGNAAVVVASDHEHFEFQWLPQEGITWRSN